MPLLAQDHEHREKVLAAIRGRRIGLAGHAAFETFSVLTRLPPRLRRTPATAARTIDISFPETRFPSGDSTRALLSTLGSRGVAGGAVYDALVAAAAAEHGTVLLTRDARALPTYAAASVSVELIT